MSELRGVKPGWRIDRFPHCVWFFMGRIAIRFGIDRPFQFYSLK